MEKQEKLINKTMKSHSKTSHKNNENQLKAIKRIKKHLTKH